MIFTEELVSYWATKVKDVEKRSRDLAELILAEVNPVNVLGPPVVTREMERKARAILKKL